MGKLKMHLQNPKIETEKEDDGRWIGAVPSISGCLVYGKTEKEAIKKVKKLADWIKADRIKHGEKVPDWP